MHNLIFCEQICQRDFPRSAVELQRQAQMHTSANISSGPAAGGVRRAAVCSRWMLALAQPTRRQLFCGWTCSASCRPWEMPCPGARSYCPETPLIRYTSHFSWVFQMYTVTHVLKQCHVCQLDATSLTWKGSIFQTGAHDDFSRILTEKALVHTSLSSLCTFPPNCTASGHLSSTQSPLFCFCF